MVGCDAARQGREGGTAREVRRTSPDPNEGLVQRILDLWLRQAKTEQQTAQGGGEPLGKLPKGRLVAAGDSLQEVLVGRLGRPGKLGTDGYTEPQVVRSEEHTSELQSQSNLVCRLLLEK